MFNYDGRRFRVVGAGPGSATGHYHQHGDLVWGEFSGPTIRRGSLCGRCADDGTIEFGYTMVLAGGEVISGHCISRPDVAPDGRLLLHETWERYGPHASRGTSDLEQV